MSDRQKHAAKSLNELTKDATFVSRLGHAHGRALTDASQPSSLFNQAILHSSTCTNFHEPKSLPEQTRINRRMKPSRTMQLTASKNSTENFKQQHKSPSNPRSSHSKKRSKSRCTCSCCLRPLGRWCERKNRHVYQLTPNHSVTNDDDDDDKLSSNDVHSRTPMVTSNLSLRARDTSNLNIVHSSSSHQHQQHQQPPAHDAHRRERIRFMKEQKTAKTLAVVVGGFILFWLPFFIMYIIPQETLGFDNLTVTLITWLGYFNSVINPFIYAYCSKQFRMAFWNITFGMCIKKSDGLTAKAAPK